MRLRAPIRRCSFCRRWKLWRRFAWRNAGQSGVSRRCERCRRLSQRQKAWHRAEREAAYRRSLPRVYVTRHAVERYMERCRPHLGRKEARTELIARIDGAPRLGEPPPWAATPTIPAGNGYLALDERTLVVLRSPNRPSPIPTREPEVAITVLTVGAAQEEVRRRARDAGWT